MPKGKEFDESFEHRLTNLEDHIARLTEEVYELRHRKIMIWSDTTTTMDNAVDETWHWVTSQLPEGFAIPEVKWTRSVRNLRILRVDLVYEWSVGLSEVKRQVLQAFSRIPRPHCEEIFVIAHRVKDWQATHPDFVPATSDMRRATYFSLAERDRLMKGERVPGYGETVADVAAAAKAAHAADTVEDATSHAADVVEPKHRKLSEDAKARIGDGQRRRRQKEREARLNSKDNIF